MSVHGVLFVAIGYIEPAATMTNCPDAVGVTAIVVLVAVPWFDTPLTNEPTPLNSAAQALLPPLPEASVTVIAVDPPVAPTQYQIQHPTLPD
jgi:hypothetical protein